eukprot:SAG22_NODE_1753_length_3656_cov_8.396683_4_plen_179_part_00
MEACEGEGRHWDRVELVCTDAPNHGTPEWLGHDRGPWQELSMCDRDANICRGHDSAYSYGSAAANSWNFDGCGCSCGGCHGPWEAVFEFDSSYTMTAFRYSNAWVPSEKPFEFYIMRSDDGQHWTEVFHSTDPDSLQEGSIVTALFDESGSARYWSWKIQRGQCPTIQFFEFKGFLDL